MQLKRGALPEATKYYGKCGFLQKAESRLNKMMRDMTEKHLNLDKKQKQSLKELQAKIATKETLLREEIKQQFQVKLDLDYLIFNTDQYQKAKKQWQLPQ